MNGLILALGVGLGKTTITFAAHHVQHIYNHMWGDISEDPSLHVPQDIADANPEIECPSKAKMFSQYGFHCPCSGGSPGRFIKEKLGVDLLLVPTGLMDTWTHEFEECFLPWIDAEPGLTRFRGDNEYGYQIIRAHHAAKEIPQRIWDDLYATETRQRLIPPDPEYAHFKTFNKADTDVAYGFSKYTPRLINGRVFVLSTTDSITKKFIDHSSNKKDVVYQYQMTEYRDKNGVRERVAKKIYDNKLGTSRRCVVATIWKDELHLRLGPMKTGIASVQAAQFSENNQGKVVVRTDLPYNCPADFPRNRISLVFLSGTPMSNGPSDLNYHYEFLKSNPAWADHDLFRRWQGGRWARQGEDFTKNLKNTILVDDEVSDKVLATITPFVEATWLCFTAESKFFGKPVVKVPRVIMATHECTHTPSNQELANTVAREDAATYEAVNKKGLERHLKARKKKDDYIPAKPGSVYYRSRVCASVPLLAKFRKADGTYFRLTNSEFWEMAGVKLAQTEDDCEVDAYQSELQQEKAQEEGSKSNSDDKYRMKSDTFIPGERGDPYLDHLDELVGSSAKIGQIKRLIKFIDDQTNGRDAEGKRPRHIFISNFYVIVHIVTLVCPLYPNQLIAYLGGS